VRRPAVLNGLQTAAIDTLREKRQS
jgi:hypothetical protein